MYVCSIYVSYIPYAFHISFKHSIYVPYTYKFHIRFIYVEYTCHTMAEMRSSFSRSQAYINIANISYMFRTFDIRFINSFFNSMYVAHTLHTMAEMRSLSEPSKMLSAAWTTFNATCQQGRDLHYGRHPLVYAPPPRLCLYLPVRRVLLPLLHT